MKLSNADRRSLAQIAGAIEAEDPEFARRMSWPAPGGADRRRRHHTQDAPGRRRWAVVVAVCAGVLLTMLAVDLLVVGAIHARSDVLAAGSGLLALTGAAAFVLRWTFRRSRR